MPSFLRCPECGYSRSWKIRRNKRKCKQKECRREWSPKNKFPVSGFRLTKTQWLFICKEFLIYGTVNGIKTQCHFSYASSQKIVLLLRQAMTDDTPSLFSGICEADETYIGGAWRNKAIHIRRQGSQRGRGTHKQPIFGIACRELGQVRTWLVIDTKRSTLYPLIEEHVEKGNIICTDSNRVYQRLPGHGYIRKSVDHEAGEYVRGAVHTQTIDGFWGGLKNHLASIGGIRKSHAYLYVGEFQWRYNFRKLTQQEQVQKLYVLLEKVGGNT